MEGRPVQPLTNGSHGNAARSCCRNADHYLIDVLGVDAENAGTAAIGRQSPFRDTPTQRPSTQTSALRGLRERLELTPAGRCRVRGMYLAHAPESGPAAPGSHGSPTSQVKLTTWRRDRRPKALEVSGCEPAVDGVHRFGCRCSSGHWGARLSRCSDVIGVVSDGVRNVGVAGLRARPLRERGKPWRRLSLGPSQPWGKGLVRTLGSQGTQVYSQTAGELGGGGRAGHRRYPQVPGEVPEGVVPAVASRVFVRVRPRLHVGRFGRHGRKRDVSSTRVRLGSLIAAGVLSLSGCAGAPDDKSTTPTPTTAAPFDIGPCKDDQSAGR